MPIEPTNPSNDLLDAITAPAPITAVSDLIDLADSLGLRELGAAPFRWAFRGQPREFGTLVPSFQRQFTRQSIGTAALIEARLIDAFRTHYLKLEDRSTDMPQPGQIALGRDLKCLSVMQHYEIPTRLLDWTTNLWTALYFACSTDAGSGAELWFYDQRIFEAQRDADTSLHLLMDQAVNSLPEPQILNRRHENLLVELDPKISPRMRRQFGHHTVSTSVFSDHAPLLFALQKQYFPDLADGDLFRRVRIDVACKGRVLQYLADELDITASTIFPDVVGLGRYLRWQFESLRTMLL